MMLGLADVRDWIKGFDIADNYYNGKLDNKKDKSIGVYQRKTSMPPRMALGGLSNTKYEVKPISVLVHWNANAKDTERASFDLYERLKTVTSLKINGIRIYYLALQENEPIEVGTDDKGVYERVINFDLYYER